MARVRYKSSKPMQLKLTAMMDVIFQLIVFFMLIMNTAAAELPKVIIPKIDDPNLSDPTKRDRVIINVITVKEKGTQKPTAQINYLQVDWKPYKKEQLPELAQYLQDKKEKIGNDAEGKPKIQIDIRADASTEYGEMQQVMQTITQTGISRFNLIASKENKP